MLQFLLRNGKACAPRFFVLPTLVFLFAFVSKQGFAQNSLYENYITLNLNGAGNTTYNLTNPGVVTGTTGLSNFDGTNLGSYTPGTNTLVLTGARNILENCDGCDYSTGNKLYYRIYLTSGSGGAYSNATLPTSTEINPFYSCGSLQEWKATGLGINVLSGLSAGTYYLEVYTEAACTSGTLTLNNSGANYKATFTVLPAATGVWVTATGGSTNVSYTTLKGAFDAINAGTHTGAITIQLYTNTTETASAVLNASGSGSASYTSISIQPAGGAARTITGAITGHLIDLNGADNVTIDGLNTGSNSLSISNTATGASSTIRFIADATNNTVTNCTISGSTTSFGDVYFSTGTTTGNDGNTISNCNIGAAGSNNPLNGIYSLGTSSAINNSGITISGNNIFDYFNAGSATSGMNINTGNSTWSITNNRLYQTATRLYTTANTHIGINITSGSGYTITGNTIGYANSSGTGTTNMVGNTVSLTGTFPSSYTTTGTANATRYIAINCAFDAAGAVSSIQNNTIAGFALYTSSGATTTNGILCGIAVTSGNANIGTTTGNTIGATSGTGSLYAATTTSGGMIAGIYATTANTITIQNNTIGAIDAMGTTSSISGSINGINVAGTGGTVVVSGNTIGNSTNPNLRMGNLTTGSNLSNAGTTFGAATGISAFNGILNAQSGTVTIGTAALPNTIRNASQNSSSASSTFRGISTSSGTITISSNSITNITSAATNTSVASGGLAGIGIYLSGGTTPSITGNTISGLSLSNTGTGGYNLAGISYTFPTTSISITKNKIFGLSNASTSTTTTTPGTAAGIFFRDGNGATTNINNNMISLGNGQTTNTSFIGIWLQYGSSTATTAKIYHNSVNIEGSVSSGAQPSFALYRGDFSTTTVTPWTVDAKNNIFSNTRSGGTGKHYAIANNYGVTTASATGWGTNASNYNVLNGTAATIGWWSADKTFAAWKTSSASDANSYSGITVTFTSTSNGDLHLNMGTTATVLESHGTTGLGISDDYDGQTRPGPSGSVNGGATAPDFGADEFDGVAIDDIAPTITYTALASTTSTANRTITFTVTDASGVPTSGAGLPVLYFRKGTSGAFASSQSTFVSGNTYTATFNYSLVTGGSVATGDVIQYYIAAQDNAGTPNVGTNPSTGASGFTSNPPAASTAPTTPSSYTIATAISGTKTVCTSGCDYTSLTNAGGAFADINSKVATGNITLQIASDLTAEAGTNALNELSMEPSNSAFTISIYPTGTSRIVSGSLASNALIRLNGADRVTIDGSLNGTGSNKNLTITNTNTTAPSAISIISLGTGLGANNNTIRNCNISTGIATTIGYGVSVGGSTPGTSGADNDNTTIQNNAITVAPVGIYANGTASASTGGDDNLTISGNTIDYNSTLASIGIQAGNALSSTISGNTVSEQTSSSQAPTGISLETGFVSSTVSSNKITKSLTSNTGGYGGRGITVGTGTASSNLTISNNFVGGVNGSNWSSYSNSSSMGIAIGTIGSSSTISTTAGGINLYYNSVSMTGSMGSGSTSAITAALYIGSGASALNIRNNILANTQVGTSTTQKNYAIYSAAANTAFTAIDYNDYYVTNTFNTASAIPGFLTSDATTLSALQTAFGGNTNSITVNPQFTSTTDLHVSVVSPVDSKATPISGITTDIDGDTRNATTPDIGADEFTYATPAAINSLSINPSSAQCTPTARTVTANVTAGGTAITSVVLNYSFNGVAQTAITMSGGTTTAGSTSNWTGTIPAAGSSGVAVTWSVSVTDAVTTVSSTGTSYTDNSPTITSFTASPNPVCSGSNVTLTAQSLIAATGTTTLGAGSDVSTLSTDGTPYRMGNSVGNQFKNQYLFLASELQAAGLQAGNITSVALTIAGSGGGTLSNFTIKMGTTSQTSMTTTYVTGLTTVWTASTYPTTGTVTTGVQTHTFTAPFNWDGTSNIVLEMCAQLATTGTAGTLAGDTKAFTATILNNPTTTACSSTTGGGTSTVRPKVTFGGTVGTNSTSSLNWTFNPGNVSGGTTGTATVNPTTNTTYSVTATDANNCSTTYGTTVAVTVNPLPTTPTGTGSNQCGTGTATWTATSSLGSGESFRWYATNSSSTILGTNSTYSESISATTVRYLAVYNGTCESQRTAVTASVTTPDAITATINGSTTPTAVCPNIAITLNGTQTGSTNVYTYSWTCTSSNAATSGISGSVSGLTQSVTPTAAGTYTYQLTGIDGTCTATSSVSIVVNAPFGGSASITASASANPVCSGSSTVLTASIATGTIPAAPAASTYCASTHSNGCSGDNISRVVLNTLDKSTGTTCGTTSSAYSNFSGLTGANTTTLTGGSSYNLTLTFGTDGNQFFGAWIDYNHDGTYSSSEFLGASGNAGASGTISVNFTVPASTAYNGLTHMRIVGGNDVAVTSSQACGASSSSFGETQDYDVTITGALSTVPYTGTVSGYLWSDGSTTVGTTNPLTVNPTVNTTYTVTATDASGCSITSSGVAITVNPLPSAPTGTGSTQCGTGTATWTATSSLGSGESFRWYATNSSATVLGTGSTYSATISSTTTIYLAVYNGTCESNRTAVTATVISPDAVTAQANGSTSPAAVCPNVSVALSAVQTGSTNVYTYSWTCTSSNAATSGINGSVSGQSVNVTPTAGGTYTYQVSAIDGTCTATSSVTILVNTPPTISSFTASPNPVCAGSNVTLTASSIGIGAGTVTLGTGSDVSTLSTSGTPYRMGNTVGNQFKNQFLFLASELQSAGLSAGNITGIKTFIAGTGGGTLSNFTIKMGTTSQTAMTSTYVTGLSTVLSLATYPSSGTVTTGLQTHTFTSAFNWDGTSNIVVEICAQLATGGSSGTLAGDATAFASTIQNSPSTTGCTGTTGGGTFNVRPAMAFSGQTSTTVTSNYTWVFNPGNVSGGTTGTATVNPTTSTTYTATATDANNCSTTSTGVLVTVNPLPSAPTGTGSNQCGTGTATWTATSSLGSGESFRWYATNSSTTVLGTSNTYSASISATTTVYLAVWNGNCESSRTAVTATVIQPDALTATANGSTTPSNVCPNNAIALDVTQTGSTNIYTYTWTCTSSNAATSGISGSVSGQSVSVTPTAGGTYTYQVTGVDGTCTATSTVTIVVNTPPVITSATATPSAVCAGSTVTLNGRSSTISSGPQTLPGTYCVPTSSGSSTLTSMTFNSLSVSGLNQVSPYYDIIAPTGSNTTSLTAGNTYTMTLATSGTSIVSVWIDYDRNGTFDASEWVQPWTSASSGTINITIPSTATAGLTGMRIRTRLNGNTNGSTDACSSFGSGGAYDFSINILSGVDFTSNYTWVWNPGNISAGNTGTATVTPTSSTNYTVTATDVNGCSSTSSPVSVTVNPVPSAPAGTATAICGTGTAVWTATSSLGSGESFRWYATSTSTTVLGTGDTYSESINSTTTRFLAVWNGNCESGRTAITSTVVQPDALTALANGSSTPAAVCLGNAIALSATQTGSTNIYTYSWTCISSNAFTSGISGSASGQSVSVTPTAAGTYSYRVTGVDGTCTAISTVIITVNPLPTITSVSANPTTVCPGGSSTITAFSGTAATFNVGEASNTQTLASLGGYGMYFSTTNAATINSVDIYPSTAGTLIVTLKDGSGTTVATRSFTIASGDISTTVKKTLALNFSIPAAASGYSINYDIAINRGEGTYTYPQSSNGFSITGNTLDGNNLSSGTRWYFYNWSVTTTIDNTSAYTWVFNPGNISGGTSGTATVNPTSTTSYTATATDANGCTNTSSGTTVTVSSGASINTDPSSAAACAGGTATFTVAASGPGTLTYQWRKNGTNISGATSATLTLSNVTSADAASYDVVVTATCGSPVTSNAATLTVTTPLAGINASATTICSGNSVTLTENGGNATSWSWSPGGAATQSITVSPTSSTTYTVTATLNGCSATASQTITVNPSPTAVSITPSSSTLCPNDNPVLLTANGGTGTLTATALSQNFSAANGWTVSNASYSATNTNWVIASSPLTDNSGSATFSNFSTQNGGGFAYANSDAGGSGSATNTRLISPVFSLAGYTSANLTFEHVYRNWAGSTQADTIVAVYISTNGGSTYSLLKDYKALGSQGTTTSNAQATTNESINLSAYLGQSNLRLLWYYNSGWGFFWIVDNVQVTGQSAQSSIVWTPNGSGSGLYTDAAGTTEYTGGATTTVYAKPATGTTATYTATATLASCSVSNTATVTVSPNNGTTTTTSACDSYTWAVNGVTYTASGTYTYTSGCDTYTLNLTITPSTSNTTSASACDSYTWSVNGVTYTASGTYTYTTGCHTEVLNLTITPSTSNTTTASACDSYTWSVNGVTYTSSGTYTYTSGCNTQILNLTITPSSTQTQTVTAAGSYTWSVNGVTYTSSGTYTATVGCVTYTLNLTITAATVTANLKLYIQGYYIGGGQMQPVLMNQGVGSSSTDVDNVTVELHDASDATIISATATGVLQTDGTLSVTFPGSVNGNSYYIEVKHRNSIQTASAAPVTMSSVTSYDFTTDASQAYGNNMAEVEPGVWALFTGDLNQDGFIDVFDFPDYDLDNFNLVSGSYVASDFNGDGFVDVFDFPVYDGNNFNLVSAILP